MAGGNTVRCIYCRAENPAYFRFCGRCGMSLRMAILAKESGTEMGKRFCTSCGREIAWDSIICPYCRNNYTWLGYSNADGAITSIKTIKPIVAGILCILGSILWVVLPGLLLFGFIGSYPYYYYYFSIFFLIFGAVSLVVVAAGICALTRRFWKFTIVGSAILSAVVPYLGVPALVLLIISKHEFR